ncbi:hypothetical protein MHY85_09985 [Cellulomonas sp. ACRRI]|uniref:hypothetical protein n=1 Tax=Cellulomonas sp. ACRRI TaxID=2918188 RepID=UPI001EF1B824|nr:hypothetical protein [Cellulomonas sp. ACRRI]MCG7286297.1 hypothetical protein [Cellulomonas sp. ACRRI]
MLQRLIAAVLGVLGVAAIGLGVASATVWRADDPLVATAAPGGGTRTLVTDPGVLELAGDPVTVTVHADGAPVVLAVGRDTDVTAWVGDDPYERVTGLSDWHTLATTAGQDAAEPTASPSGPATEEPAEAAPSPSASEDAGTAAAQAADPTGNDMWVAEVAGDGSATLEWTAQEGRWSLLAVSLGDAAPVLDLSWPQTVTTPWLWPGVALGVLLLAVAAILLVRILRQRREGPDAGWTDVSTGTLATVPLPAAGAAPGDGATAAGTPTGAIPVGTVTPGVPLTRRQIREAEAAAAAARKRGGRAPTGAVPVVTGATPVVTGATPVVTGATPAAGRATPGEGTTPGGTSGGAARAETPGPTSGRPARDDATTTLPATPPAPPAPVTGAPGAPGAPTSAPPAQPAGAGGTSSAAAAPAAQGAGAAPEAGPTTRGTGEGRRLADRLPWRRGRASHDEPGAPDGDAPTGSASTGTGGGSPAPATGSSGTGSGTPRPTGASSWTPVPGAAPAARPGPAGPPPTSSPAAPPAGTPASPSGGPGTGARPPAAPGGPAGAQDDDAATRAQRADAWRRMWGFPSTDADAPPQQDDDRRTEEGR